MQLSYSHLKSMLWAESGAHVHAVVSAAVIPGLPARLKEADVRGWDGLLRGALPPEQAARAPYVVELLPDGAFTDWLLREASRTYPGWGVVAVGPLPLMAMREHGRRLLHVGMPDGAQRKWTWFDPALWGGLLPRLDPMQLDEAFGAVTDWVVVSASSWQWFTLSAGRLTTTARECLPEQGA